MDHPAEATRVGSYEIVRRLARGGMAELYLARSVGPEGFEKLLVLKRILPHFADNPKFVKLFLDEAKLAAGLDHPHIAHVYDMGMVEGSYFFTMEYIHGQDVRRTLRRAIRLGVEFPLDHAVQIARNVAAALHYAHERRRADGTLLELVHRDVSPSNVLISYDGAVKLVDFGVAKAATSSVKTRTGTLKGKISYMSPEQAKGAQIDRRSDIFSLGIVLWEMVAMHRLFKADNDLATIQMIINSQPPPPHELRPGCSPELSRIVMRALAADATTRYQTSEELQLDLEELAREQKLKQSTVALRSFMHDLFTDEIRAWDDAKASGVTLTEFVATSAIDMTKPLSESELSFIEDEEDAGGHDEPDPDSEPPTELPKSGPDAPTVQMAPVRLRPPPGTPPPSPQPALSNPFPTPSHPFPPVRAATPLPIEAGDPGPGPSFPVAPREWRPETGLSPQQAVLVDRRRKQVIIAGACTFSAIVLIALIFGGGGRAAPEAASAVAAPPAAETDVPPAKTDMLEQPEAVERPTTAPVTPQPSQPVVVPPAAGPSSAPAAKPTETRRPATHHVTVPRPGEKARPSYDSP